MFCHALSVCSIEKLRHTWFLVIATSTEVGPSQHHWSSLIEQVSSMVRGLDFAGYRMSKCPFCQASGIALFAAPIAKRTPESVRLQYGQGGRFGPVLELLQPIRTSYHADRPIGITSAPVFSLSR